MKKSTNTKGKKYFLLSKTTLRYGNLVFEPNKEHSITKEIYEQLLKSKLKVSLFKK